MDIVRPSARVGVEISRWASRDTRTAFSTATKAWTCVQCRSRLDARRTWGGNIEGAAVWKRQFSSTFRRLDDKSTETKRPIEPVTTTAEAETRLPKDKVETETHETSTPASSSTTLPSHTANKRSELSQRTSKILDSLLARASLASQHINQYTGTDYSGIEALRKEIIDQEQKVRSLHSEVEDSKSRHHEAYAKQTSAQREIVALLERKSSWSPSDLEKYMSLVRSEHLNDQDVQAAKDNLASAERSLEDARSLLERLERKQYHEEQIWSDTIRRNSTWVTFGLMGLNILLLLTQIAIFEPYRRKKIVREMQAALDERTLHANPAIEPKAAEKQADNATPPSDATSETILAVTSSTSNEVVAKETLAAGEVLPAEATDVVAAIPTPSEVVQDVTPEYIAAPIGSKENTLEAWQEAFRDLFSERIVQLRKVDVTNTALQGAAAGVAVMGILFVLLRPH
ncbi:Sensitive to high expression protein 9, mitochondrial [Fulvia fulva]|nr:Sensitive to high expression protein 9, mitochondrial [Fulvia fulva]